MAITLLDGMLLIGLGMLFSKKWRKIGAGLIVLSLVVFLLGIMSFGILPLVK